MVERFGPADPNLPYMSYGYMWWLIDEFQNKEVYQGAYTAIGYGGQFITVFPTLKMVVAHKTKLNLLTMLGITYKATEDPVYYNIIEQLINARIND